MLMELLVKKWMVVARVTQELEVLLVEMVGQGPQVRMVPKDKKVM